MILLPCPDCHSLHAVWDAGQERYVCSDADLDRLDQWLAKVDSLPSWHKRESYENPDFVNEACVWLEEGPPTVHGLIESVRKLRRKHRRLGAAALKYLEIGAPEGDPCEVEEKTFDAHFKRVEAARAELRAALDDK